MPYLRLLQALDTRVGPRLSLHLHARALRPLALALAHSGDSLLWLAAAAAMLVWGRGNWTAAGWRIIAATLLSGIVTAILKRAIRRQRPANDPATLYIGPDHYSFPSGHAGRTACLVLVLSPLLPVWGALLLTTWMLTLAVARVALRVHFVSDILAGWIVGLISGLTILSLADVVGPLHALHTVSRFLPSLLGAIA